MTTQAFQRYEKKYVLSKSQYLDLMCSLASKMSVDDYGKHTICNVYFDTRDYQLIRTSLERPQYKEKLRIRSYGTPGEDDMVFIELKKKYQGIVYKRRTTAPLREARKYLYYGIYPEKDDQVTREADFTFRRRCLQPAAYISYDRIAFCGNANADLRVTFDTNIRGRSSALDLNKGSYGSYVLPPDQILMEVKIPGAMPVWMSRLFSRLSIFPGSFSKYGTYYKEYISGKTGLRGGEIYA